jgi:hypothetical protein
MDLYRLSSFESSFVLRNKETLLAMVAMVGNHAVLNIFLMEVLEWF